MPAINMKTFRLTQIKLRINQRQKHSYEGFVSLFFRRDFAPAPRTHQQQQMCPPLLPHCLRLRPPPSPPPPPPPPPSLLPLGASWGGGRCTCREASRRAAATGLISRTPQGWSCAPAPAPLPISPLYPSFYRVTQDTGHLVILAKSQALYNHDLDIWKCLIL